MDWTYQDQTATAQVIVLDSAQIAQLSGLADSMAAGELGDEETDLTADQLAELYALYQAGQVQGLGEDDDVQLGGFFKKVGKALKKVGKTVGKVAKVALPIAAAALPVAGGVFGAVSSAISATAPKSASWLDSIRGIIDTGGSVIDVIRGGTQRPQAPAPTPVMGPPTPAPQAAGIGMGTIALVGLGGLALLLLSRKR